MSFSAGVSRAFMGFMVFVQCSYGAFQGFGIRV